MHSAGSSGDASSSGSTTGTTADDQETTGTSTTNNSTETTETTETTDDSTGEPAATCGNGILEAFGPEPEECDDGNLDPEDGCSDTCALDRRVFVTSIEGVGAPMGDPRKQHER